MVLVIGNKRYSSWSLRPWVLLRHFEIPFEERLVPLGTMNTASQILCLSPSGKVPALIDNGLTIWDSLAIAEYLNELFPEKGMWPADPKLRAVARCVSNEMHSGFSLMRERMPHNLGRTFKDFDCSVAKNDIDRVKTIWGDCLAASPGSFLFGNFCIADAMFLPVVNRFMTYGVRTEGVVAKYVESMRSLPAFEVWLKDAEAETLRVPKYE